MVEISLYQYVFIVIASLLIISCYQVVCMMDNKFTLRKLGMILIIQGCAFLGHACLNDYNIPVRNINLTLIGFFFGVFIYLFSDRRKQ